MIQNDGFEGLKRTDMCGELRKKDIGRQAVVFGFVQRTRNLGSLIFVDLRDRSGIVQLAFDENTKKEIFEKAERLKAEYVLAAKGTVRLRESINREIPTGDIEILVDELRILSHSETPPFEIADNSGVKEENRLRYRYLDLRRPSLQKNIMLRHKITKKIRDYFDKNGFIEIETPVLIKSTPEGARDFLVPSRIHRGEFYALPQSPQLYKQLLMVSGFDRYFQIARCFRDEDLRADRQPEFTQVDMEMSFATMQDIMEVNEGLIKELFDEILGIKLDYDFPKLSYSYCMEKYGSDKPDTRFGMLIEDLTDIVKNSGFSVFSSACQKGGVAAITAKDAAAVFTRKEIDKLTEYVKGIGAGGLAYIRWAEDSPNCSFSKFVDQSELDKIIARTNAQKGDVVFIIADQNKKSVLTILGALRLKVAKKLSIIPDQYNFLWVTEMPFFELDENTGEWVAMHHPFTAPLDECIQELDKNPGKVRAKAYDLVLNGVELSSGSIRITDPVLQNRMFKALGLTEREISQKFGFLTEAFRYGAPPHGGMAIGLDRLVMLMLDCESIREVIAFPKVQNMRELMTDCPTAVEQAHLEELGITVANTKKYDCS